MDIFRPSLWIPSKRDAHLAPPAERMVINLPPIGPDDDSLRITNESDSDVYITFLNLCRPDFYVVWSVLPGDFRLFSPNHAADDRTPGMVKSETVRIFCETGGRVIFERGQLGEPVCRAP